MIGYQRISLDSYNEENCEMFGYCNKHYFSRAKHQFSQQSLCFSSVTSVSSDYRFTCASALNHSGQLANLQSEHRMCSTIQIFGLFLGTHYSTKHINKALIFHRNLKQTSPNSNSMSESENLTYTLGRRARRSSALHRANATPSPNSRCVVEPQEPAQYIGGLSARERVDMVLHEL